MSSATSHDDQQEQQQRQQGHEQAPLKPQANKKQARRRMHTSKPYQERLLNMAEARREIVTALRIHRANMRQQSKCHHQQEKHQLVQLQQPVQVMFQEQSQAFEGVPVAMSYASSSNILFSSSPLAHLIDGSPAGNYSSSSMLSYGLTPVEEAPAAIGGLEQLACSLPAQPLGLNLSFQGFGVGGSLDSGKNSDDPFGAPLIPSSSTCPASSYLSPVVMAMAGGHAGSLAFRATEEYSSSSADAPAAALRPVLDGDVYCSIGDGGRQGVEWSEAAAANVAAASAWWTKILESTETGSCGVSAGPPQTTTGGEVGMEDGAAAAAGEWQWLCNGVGVEEQEVTGPNKPDIVEMHADDGEGDYSSCYEAGHKDNGGGIALPCVDIGDIEGWDDGEWFS